MTGNECRTLLFIVLLFEFGSFAAPVAILSSVLLSTSGVHRTADHAHHFQHLIVYMAEF